MATKPQTGDRLILTRKRPPHRTCGCPAMRVSPYVYNTAAQLASEIGTSMVKVLDILVDYAVDHITWEGGDQI